MLAGASAAIKRQDKSATVVAGGLRYHPWSAWSQMVETTPSARSIMRANGDAGEDDLGHGMGRADRRRGNERDGG
jgi:hypothetical protein